LCVAPAKSVVPTKLQCEGRRGKSVSKIKLDPLSAEKLFQNELLKPALNEPDKSQPTVRYCSMVNMKRCLIKDKYQLNFSKNYARPQPAVKNYLDAKLIKPKRISVFTKIMSA
jgi:hypothetical protein